MNFYMDIHISLGQSWAECGTDKKSQERSGMFDLSMAFLASISFSLLQPWAAQQGRLKFQ